MAKKSKQNKGLNNKTNKSELDQMNKENCEKFKSNSFENNSK